jgi:prophage antirepressor-like protein
MEHSIITNQELGHAYFYWESKHGRIFLASQVMKELGYLGGNKTLYSFELKEGIDVIKFSKKYDRDIFDELSKLNLLGQRASEVIFLSESGFWKLVMQSRKSIGIKTRDWLANEVLPSIRKTGVYSVASNNPMAIFTERNKQLELSKKSNGILSKTKNPEAYAKFWNDLHLLVVGLDAKGIKAIYKSKVSAKEVLRKHAPHLEATEAVIEEIWASGIGLDQIKKTELHKSLAHSFNALLSLGVDIKTLGK